jgi:integrase
MACITKRRDRYVIDCYDQNGKRYRKTLKEGTTKGQAKQILSDIENKISKRIFVHEKKTLLFSEVAKQWLEYKKPNLRETTWLNYEGIVSRNFGAFSDIKISLITTATVEQFFTSLQVRKRRYRKRVKAKAANSLRPETTVRLNTVRGIIGVLSQIMTYAVRHKMIDSNPVRDAERPRKTIGDDGDNRVVRVLEPEQIKRFLDAVEDPKYQTLFLTAVMTGARQGELLGLKWPDVDFEKKQIYINRTFNHGLFFSPKTRLSRRAIDLAPIVIKELRKWKLASPPNELDLVFPNDKGQPMICNGYVHRPFVKALAAAGCLRIRFHDLRHTYASLLIQQGENIKYIQTQLGHATPTMTLNVYSHLMKSENQAAALRLENAVFPENGHKVVTNTGS